VTTPISGIATGTTGTAASSTPAPAKTLDQNAFLQLLVAQMRYQDPSKPMDADAMMSEEATFTQVQQLTQLVTTEQNLLSSQHLQAASAMVGKTVAFTNSDGTTATGVVTSATLTGSDPTLKVGNKDVPLSSVTEVRSTAG
jgi:flagellar basal-body rod modification protein FlgD